MVAESPEQQETRAECSSPQGLAAIPVIAVNPMACDNAESFALQVLGESMLPEFAEGDIVIVEPGGHAVEGSFVLAHWQDEWTLRQLRRDGDGWSLAALAPDVPPQPIPDLGPVRGVVIQRSKPGRRRSVKRYVG